VVRAPREPGDYLQPPDYRWFLVRPIGREPANQPCTWYGFQPELVRTTQQMGLRHPWAVPS
jgi:hypothetical protein